MKNKHHFFFVIGEILFIIGIILLLYFFYPKTKTIITGNFVKFDSDNANFIIISKFSDFKDPRYIDLNELKNLSINLSPGKYYWKSYNNFIEGFSHELVVDSDVALVINRTKNNSDLVNVGDVKINITKSNDGKITGNFLLDPSEAKEIEDKNENYLGKEHE
jgi:hypothetical protein